MAVTVEDGSGFPESQRRGHHKSRAGVWPTAGYWVHNTRWRNSAGDARWTLSANEFCFNDFYNEYSFHTGYDIDTVLNVNEEMWILLDETTGLTIMFRSVTFNLYTDTAGDKVLVLRERIYKELRKQITLHLNTIQYFKSLLSSQKRHPRPSPFSRQLIVN